MFKLSYRRVGFGVWGCRIVTAKELEGFKQFCRDWLDVMGYVVVDEWYATRLG
jgi:hypothetical protein